VRNGNSTKKPRLGRRHDDYPGRSEVIRRPVEIRLKAQRAKP
jgi:hypothetical protein